MLSGENATECDNSVAFGMIQATNVKISRRFKGRAIYNQTIEA